MKFLTLLLLFAAITTTGTRAQEQQQQSPASASEPPDLQVVKFGWSKERLGWERDPFGGPVENFDEMRVRSRNEKRIDDAKRGGSASDVDRVRREAKADSAILAEGRNSQTPPRYGFRYKVSVRNTGTKVIKSLDWDHVFFDPQTKIETGRHQFTGDEKINPGKQKEISVFIASPPARTVSVYELNRRERATVAEQIIITRIKYADGSVWQPTRLPEVTQPQQ